MSKNSKKLADDFIGLYPVSKTLRFELKPIGRTQEYIELHGILKDDFQRAEDYKKVKKIIDRYHKKFIDEALEGLQLDGLEGYRRLYEISKRDSSQEKEFQKIQDFLRKQVAKQFSRHPQYKKLFKKELIKEVLLSFTKENAEEQELIKSFSDFTTYFNGFYQNRENMYSEEGKSTTIAYRIVHQNLPKYIDNMKVFSEIQKTEIGESIAELSGEIQRKIEIDGIQEYFQMNGFNKVVTQQGIDQYNTILGAFSEEGKTKIKGLNEYINLYNQKYQKRIPKLKPLFKQILSDKEKISFILESFSTDSEVLEAVRDFYNNLQQAIFENEKQINIDELLKNISSYNVDKIYVKNDACITKISNAVFDEWSHIPNAISNYYDINANEKRQTAKYAEKKEKVLSKVKLYSLGELNVFVEQYSQKPSCVEKYFENEISKVLDQLYNAYRECSILHNNQLVGRKSLCKDKQAVSELKALLDSIKELQWLLKPLMAGQEEADKDEAFYAELSRIWEELDAITPLYNKVRNYITKKPYSLEKVKLNFYKSTLLDGWDRNKEKDNLGILLMKDDLYYLGIINRKFSKVIDQGPETESGKAYQKMEYKLLPGPNKMLPKVFFSKSRKDEFAPSHTLQENYNRGTHKKGDNFNLKDCHGLIDFFKNSIQKHKDWSQFDFHFSDTETYEDISGFYREVEHQGYKITFRNIDEEYIDSLVEEGKLYLFQIYNKDFSPYSKGTPNLHTLYWKMLFSPENLQNVVYKLNGQAEIFYRKASIKSEDIITHEANVPIKNKDPQNETKTSTFQYTLVKDKRFTCDKFQFHVPITMNFQAEGINRLNHKVNRLIHDAEDLHIIGIDRGERNLLYLSLIDMKGNIIKQMSLNQIISYDKNKREHERNYHQLLQTRENENRDARQSWQTIHTIKELKEGYLSQVIHIITDWMIEYNAIIVLEDLNFGFMRGRQKFERQVYQKFEKMLIDKLNYLVDKKKSPQENGGLLNAYQLTDKFESFQKLGKQSGFLYYIPAWNTSKIDPTTGFVNLFYTKYESIEKSREFIQKFDSISYNTEKKYFEFAFDYSKFTFKAEGSRLKWTVCSQGNRIYTYKNSEKNNQWDMQKRDVTDDMKELLESYGISILEKDLRESMTKIEKADFYNKFMKIFSLIVQMRNSNEQEDKLISPVKNARGEFFETGKDGSKPLDADANGAYNIARKGLWIVEQIKSTDVDQLEKIKLAISNKEWLKYAQEHTL